MSDKRSFTLDAMRGITALAVVTSHTGAVSPPMPLRFSFLAVDFFFLLSGFVLARAYQPRLQAGLSAWRFMEIRFVRLFPMFILGSAVGLVYAAGQFVLHKPHALAPQHLMAAFASSFVMLPDLHSRNFLFPLNGPSWTVFVEVLINSAFALLLFRLRSSILLVVSAACAAVYVWGAVHVGTGNLGWAWSTILYGIVRGGYAFPLGVVLGRIPKSTMRPPSLWALPPTGLLVWLLFVGLPVRQEADFLVLSFAILPAIVWLGASLPPPEALRPVCQTVGDISYPFFAVHYPLLHILFYLFVKQWGFPGWLVLAAFFPAMALLAWILFHNIDVPVRQWLTARSRPRPAAVPVAP